MVDREKVIKALEKCSFRDCPTCPYYSQNDSRCIRELIYDALTLLKEQEPIPPKIESADLKALGVADKDITSENIDKWTFRWCGNCNNLLLRTDKFCNKCGRKVKWE